MLTPRDQADLCELVSSVNGSLSISSFGSKSMLGRPMHDTQDVSLINLRGITLYEPAELVVEARVATPLSEVETLLAENNQQLAFEPPDYSRILGSNHRGSIASVLACNLSGPRRLTAGAARDHILGVEGVSGLGEPFKGGGRVVKNVTGYDMPRLLAGSFGTLAALSTVTFKVLPRPESELTIGIPGADLVEAGALMRLVMQAPLDVSCAAWTPLHGVLLRLEGIAASVAERRIRLALLVKRGMVTETDERSRRLWDAVRDLSEIDDGAPIIWKISVPPSDGPILAQALLVRGAKIIMDWSGGLVWAAMTEFFDVRTIMVQGQALLFKAPAEIRETHAVFHPQSPDLARLSARLKSSLDPQRRFNPGRMYKSV
jgi:glycolate oxidase FAD binding subunit